MRNCIKIDTIFHTMKTPTRPTCRTKLYVIVLLIVRDFVSLYTILELTILTITFTDEKIVQKIVRTTLNCRIYCMKYCINYVNNCTNNCMRLYVLLYQ